MKRIYAIMTLYKPDREVAKNCRLIAEQVDTLYLSDNSSDEHFEMFSDIPNTTYISNKKNLGISKAFNQVLLNQEFLDSDYVIFFDQDSKIQKHHIEQLVEEYENISITRKVGCIGPMVYDHSNNIARIPKGSKPITSDTYRIVKIITSSMLTQYGKLKEIGFWNENLFLDFADWDLCWRFASKGYQTCITNKILLDHRIGKGEKKIGKIRLRVGAEIREYYQTRDAVYLLKEKYVPFRMRFKLLSNVTIRPVIHYFFLENKKVRMSYVIRGFEDSKKNVHGEFVG